MVSTKFMAESLKTIIGIEGDMVSLQYRKDWQLVPILLFYKTMEKAFANNPQAYFDLLANMSYGKPDSITGIANLKPAHFVAPKDNNWTKTAFVWSSIGYNQHVSANSNTNLL